MKSKSLLIVLTVLFSISVYADFVPGESAKKVALNFYFEKYNQFEGTVLYDQLSIRQVYTETDGIHDFFYVFQINGKGFVIVPADDCLAPVLGYSFEHEYVSENQPPNVQYWFGQYKEQVIFARENQIEPEKNISIQWAYYLADSFNSTKPAINSKEVEPLITTLWGQIYPFNLYCPVDPESGSYTVTGCSATAIAQIAYYWRWPDHGQGYTSYTPESNPQLGVQTADYENTWYRYEEMVDDPETANTAIAEYIYHFGVCLNSEFSTIGTFPSNFYMSHHQLLLDSLDYHFKLIPSNMFYADSMTNEEWKNNILDNLNMASPVWYAGYSQYPDGGHVFVCDGYQDEEYFHFNLGWYGNSNGYYTLNNILGYNSSQFCSSLVQPDTVNFNYPFYANGADTLTYLEGSITDGSGPMNDYLNNTQASWLIDPQTEYDSVTKITIMVKRLDIFNDGDKLCIYDGEDNSAPLLAELNGSILPDDIESSGNKVFIEFITDGTNTAPGFYLDYITGCPTWCSGMTQLTEQAATISDGSGSFYYQNFSSCTWIIDPGITDSLTIYFNYFNTEEENDVLRIYDGVSQEIIATISGNYEIPPDPVTVESGKALLAFLTNGSVRGDGWEVWYDINLGLTENSPNFNLQIIPNPVTSEVKINFNLHSAQPVSVEIFDIVGSRQIEIKDKTMTSGNQVITLNLDELPGGIYFCCLKIGNETVTKKIIKIK